MFFTIIHFTIIQMVFTITVRVTPLRPSRIRTALCSREACSMVGILVFLRERSSCRRRRRYMLGTTSMARRGCWN